MLAMEGGADFIKTSTGKNYPGANHESVMAMAFSIREYRKKTGRLVGLKPSGGIKNLEDALEYIKIVKNILGVEFISPKYFRIGASSLFDDCYKRINKVLLSV